jgi:hypothetical protein
MRSDLVIIPEDHPGVLADLGEVLGAAGINIEAISAFTGKGKGIVHILVREPEPARDALSRAGFDVRAARGGMCFAYHGLSYERRRADPEGDEASGPVSRWDSLDNNPSELSGSPP